MQVERPRLDELNCGELSIADADCIQIRKTFCAVQIGLSDFIRHFAEINGIEDWFIALKNSLSRLENTSLAEENHHTWVGDMCVHSYSTVPSAHTLHYVWLLLLQNISDTT